MSRLIQGNCVDIMSTFPDRAVDFILTDPPYLVGFRDRSGRSIAGDKTDEWLQPACNQMYRVLKKDSLLISFYGWNRVDPVNIKPETREILHQYKELINARRRDADQSELTIAHVMDEICEYMTCQCAVYIGGHFILQGGKSR